VAARWDSAPYLLGVRCCTVCLDRWIGFRCYLRPWEPSSGAPAQRNREQV